MKCNSPLLFSLPLVMLFVSCGDQSDDQLRLLVGNGEMKAAASQPDETIRLSLVNVWENPNRHLDVVLGPDQALAIKSYQVVRTDDRAGESKMLTLSEESLRLSEVQSFDLRSRLSVFRPERLADDGPFILPKGCNFISDGSSRAVVAFSDDANRGGYFILQEGCDQPSAKQLEDALRSILASLPPTNTSASFEWARSQRTS